MQEGHAAEMHFFARQRQPRDIRAGFWSVRRANDEAWRSPGGAQRLQRPATQWTRFIALRVVVAAVFATRFFALRVVVAAVFATRFIALRVVVAAVFATRFFALRGFASRGATAVFFAVRSFTLRGFASRGATAVFFAVRSFTLRGVATEVFMARVLSGTKSSGGESPAARTSFPVQDTITRFSSGVA